MGEYIPFRRPPHLGSLFARQYTIIIFVAGDAKLQEYNMIGNSCIECEYMHRCDMCCCPYFSFSLLDVSPCKICS